MAHQRFFCFGGTFRFGSTKIFCPICFRVPSLKGLKGFCSSHPGLTSWATFVSSFGLGPKRRQTRTAPIGTTLGPETSAPRFDASARHPQPEGRHPAGCIHRFSWYSHG